MAAIVYEQQQLSCGTDHQQFRLSFGVVRNVSGVAEADWDTQQWRVSLVGTDYWWSCPSFDCDQLPAKSSFNYRITATFYSAPIIISTFLSTPLQLGTSDGMYWSSEFPFCYVHPVVRERYPVTEKNISSNFPIATIGFRLSLWTPKSGLLMVVKQ